MTSEDAIKIITQVEDGVIIPRYRPVYDIPGECITRAKISEALNLAIEALKEVDKWKKYKEECDSYHTK